MKTNTKHNLRASLAALLLVAASSSLASAAERVVDLSELPAPTKKALDEARRGEAVTRVTVKNAGGRTVYDVEFGHKENASPERLRITADGKILGDTRKASSASAGDVAPSAPRAGADTSPTLANPNAPLGYPGAYPGGVGYEPYVVPMPPKLQLDELPKAAQETIRREAAQREIAAIHEDTIDGRKAYVAQFRDSGRNPRVYVAEDGSVLRPTEKPPVLALGTTFADTPAPVQQTLRREIGDGEIVNIDKEKEGRGDIESYNIEVKDSRGSYRLRVSADGRVLANTREAKRSPGKG